jgi:hypothetical protein
MAINPNARTFHKDQVLEFLMHHLPMDMRRKLGSALPEAYNDVVGQEVVKSVHVEDLRLNGGGIKGFLE